MSETARKYLRVLHDFEDYVRLGERIPHEISGEPAFKVSSPEHPAGRARSNTTHGRLTPLSNEERTQRLEILNRRVAACTLCVLHEKRMTPVPGEGVLDPLVMVIGEGPGADEDRRGLPFVGKAGQYLDKWLEAIDLSRKTNAYIGNIVKCRPPGNRDPLPEESTACLPFLHEQIDLIRPRTILSVGRIASGILIGSSAGIGRLRGRTYNYNGIPLIPTYHPAGVLRNQAEYRRPVWDDLRRLAAVIQEQFAE